MMFFSIKTECEKKKEKKKFGGVRKKTYLCTRFGRTGV